MTWRERLAAARERGRFSAEDVRLSSSVFTCMAQEVAERYGHSYARMPGGWLDLWVEGTAAYLAIEAGDVDLAERCLDRIEDDALRLKRFEGASRGEVAP